MGWYDAFAGDVTKVDTSKINTNAMKAFGDAFKDIGASLKENELNEKKVELTNSQLETEKLNRESKKTELENKADAWLQKEDDTDYVSNAFKYKDKKSFSDAFTVDATNQPSVEAMEKVATYFKEQDTEAQKKFNSAATKTAASYDSWDKFKSENPTLIENADGPTIQTIKTGYDKTAQNIKDLKNQKTLNSLQASLDKKELAVAKAKSDKTFKYDEDTGVKIKNLIKTSMGLDNELTSFDDKKKQEFNNIVTGVSSISKKYNLEPIPAYELFLKTMVKEESKEKETPKKKSWKDIDIN